MEAKYIAEKYCGRVYCGNAFLDTIEKCIEFGDDGFCDKVKIINIETQEKKTIKFEYQK